MSGVKKSGDTDTRNATPPGDADPSRTLRAFIGAFGTALDLRSMIEKVTLDEFHRQEDRYEHDCSLGRELLFLIANQEWVQGTSEIININRADAIETEIKIDIDLHQITHGAFREKTGQLWLPVSVLPLPSAQDRLEPDPFATVIGAAGNLLPLMPADDMSNQIAAALAEIIVNMAIAHAPDLSSASAPKTQRAKFRDERDATLRAKSRDQRVLLAAAIYHLLRRGSGQHRAATATASSDDGITTFEEVKEVFDEFVVKAAAVKEVTEAAIPAARFTTARNRLLCLIDPYINHLGLAAGRGTPKDKQYQFVPELAYRAIRVLQALAASTIIVVPVDFGIAPTVLTIRVPARDLTATVNPQATGSSDSPRPEPAIWRRSISWLKSRNWLIRPSGHLEIHVLLPMADADRQIQLHLPDGMSFAKQSTQEGDIEAVPPRLDIKVSKPAPLRDLSAAQDEADNLSAEHDEAARLSAAQDEAANAKRPSWPAARPLPLADLARAKKEVAGGLEHYYDERAPSPDAAPAPSGRHAGHREPAPERPAEGDWFRRTSAGWLGSRTLVARAEMIEDITQHATPEEAIVHADVTVDARDYFSEARTFSIMSIIVMAIILASIVGWQYLAGRSEDSTEVAAIVLTLFATIQADRMRRPDRTTLKGLLSSAGILLIALSVLPSLTLAIALSFKPGVLGASAWAAGCIAAQAVFLAFTWRGPLTATTVPSYQRRRSSERRWFHTAPLDYSHFEAIRSDYWRNTTAEALMLGRMAYGYVVWQGTEQPRDEAPPFPPQLKPLLTRGNAPASMADAPANVVALLHSSTQRQAITFAVFRDKPYDWVVDDDFDENHVPKPFAPIIRRLDLDPDRLAPMDNVTSQVDVFVGLHGELPALSRHPLITVLEAARKKLIVLEALFPFPPPPLDGYPDTQWARVRVALRDAGDIRRLTLFLNKIYEDFAERGYSEEYVLAVQADPIGPPRVIFGGAKPPDTRDEHAPEGRSGDLHIPVMSEPSNAPTWRLVTKWAEARSNIESDIIEQLRTDIPDSQLMHLNFAVLHGIAVIILMLHERCAPSASNHSAENAEISEEHADAPGMTPSGKAEPDRKGIVINGRVSLDQLGPIVPCPLVRIRFRWQERPGGFLSVLNSINSALERKPPAIGRKDRSVSYARLHVATGRIAEGDLTVRLHSPARDGLNWTQALTERMTRNISADAVLEANATYDPRLSNGYRDRPENPVIHIDLLGGDLLRRAPQPPVERLPVEQFSADPDLSPSLGAGQPEGPAVEAGGDPPAWLRKERSASRPAGPACSACTTPETPLASGCCGCARHRRWRARGRTAGTSMRSRTPWVCPTPSSGWWSTEAS